MYPFLPIILTNLGSCFWSWISKTPHSLSPYGPNHKRKLSRVFLFYLTWGRYSVHDSCQWKPKENISMTWWPDAHFSLQAHPLSGPQQNSSYFSLKKKKKSLAVLVGIMIMGRGLKPRNFSSVFHTECTGHIWRVIGRIYWREDNLPVRDWPPSAHF
jgi:hypothetical protein